MESEFQLDGRACEATYSCSSGRFDVLIETICFVADGAERPKNHLLLRSADLPIFRGLGDGGSREQCGLGKSRRKIAHCEERKWPARQRDSVRILFVDCLETKWHADFELDTVAVLPGPAQLKEFSRNNVFLNLLAVDGNSGASVGPTGDAQING